MGWAKRLTQLVKVGDFDLDGPMARVAVTHSSHSLGNTANRGDVIVLDHRHVVQTDAMVLPTAQPHGPFVQHPQARHGLARVQDHGLRAGDGIHKAPRHRRDARHTLQEVQRHPLSRSGSLGLDRPPCR